MTRNCYTYLIGWTQINKWYYGVRWAIGCSPDDLWVKYFTSSTFVKNQRELYGEPDIISVRKQFGEDSKKAKIWEDRVLKRLDVKKNTKWLNQSVNNSFRAVDKSWNEGLKKEECPSLEKAGRNISKARKGKLASEKAKQNMKISSQKRKRENSWTQLKTNSKFNKFNSYDDFKESVLSEYKSCWKIPLVIANKIDVTESGVKTLLKHEKLEFTQNSRITKVFNNYGSLFSSFEEYTTKILELHLVGKTPFQIGNLLSINSWGVLTVLKQFNCKPNVSKTGPKKGSKTKVKSWLDGGNHKWYNNSILSKRFDSHPGEGWYLGRKLSRK